MFSKKMISHITVAATVLVLSGCSTSGLNNIDPNNTNNGSNSTQSPINDLKFTKVSENKKSEYNTLITQNAVSESSKQSAGATGSANAPTAQAVPVPMVAVAGDAKMASGISAYPMSYFPQPGVFEEYVVIDFEEAKTAGFSGTYINTLNTIVKPITKNLNSDIRMVNSYGSSDDNGVNQSSTVNNSQGTSMPSPGYYNPYQWQFTFVSSSKKEVYNIFISSTETLVLRQKWGIKDLNPDEIKIDSSDAINLVKKAIADKKFTSPDSQQNYVDPAAEVLYELPKDATWYLYLEKDKGKLVWSLNFNYTYPNIIAYAKGADGGVSARVDAVNSTTTSADPSIAVGEPNPSMPTVPEYWYNGGYARVDAATGEILSLVRPTRYRNIVTPPCCKTEPMPLPMPVEDKPTAETK